MNALRCSRFRASPVQLSFPPSQIRRASTTTNEQGLANGNRQCLSKLWLPRGPQSPQSSPDSHQQLLEAGFLHQPHAGIFHLLPLGLRVQSKLTLLIQAHMHAISATELSLSSLSTPTLWQRSGRLAAAREDLFQLRDRRQRAYLLSPTHEEEITSLVQSYLHSHRDLPLRLFQISRKYRDEPRPRGGLLRGREFLMKDLYTFDLTKEQALETYAEVRGAYKRIFDALRVPYLVAGASSGAMGGELSDEVHYPSPRGEDVLLRCDACPHVVNVETLPAAESTSAATSTAATASSSSSSSSSAQPPKCPRCSTGHLANPIPSIEVAHIFHLGTRYSQPFDLAVDVRDDPASSSSTVRRIPLQMGCHGIGVSRLIDAIADNMADSAGLNWPAVVAPFQVCVTSPVVRSELGLVYDTLSGGASGTALGGTGGAGMGMDVVIDERARHGFGWRMKDADLVGYPVVVVVGKSWDEGGEGLGDAQRRVEVQCRQLKVKQLVPLQDLRLFVEQLLQKL